MMTTDEVRAARALMAKPGYAGPLHEHDGYLPHSHEVRADHEGVARQVIPVGSERYPSEVMRVRDPRQRAAVTAIMDEPGFAFATSNPFTAEAGNYSGPFTFAYFTEDGILHTLKISKTGRVMLRHDGTAPTDIRPLAIRVPGKFRDPGPVPRTFDGWLAAYGRYQQLTVHDLRTAFDAGRAATEAEQASRN